MRRAACTVPVLASSWTLAVPQGGFLRVRFVSGGPHASTLSLGLRSRHHRAAGAAPALGPRLDSAGSPGAAGLAVGGQAPSRQHRRLPALPATSGWRPLTPSPLPSQEGSESPSAVSGAGQETRQAPHTASVWRRDTASRPSPSGGLAASLDSLHALATPPYSVAERVLSATGTRKPIAARSSGHHHPSRSQFSAACTTKAQLRRQARQPTPQRPFAALSLLSIAGGARLDGTARTQYRMTSWCWPPKNDHMHWQLGQQLMLEGNPS